MSYCPHNWQKDGNFFRCFECSQEHKLKTVIFEDSRAVIEIGGVIAGTLCLLIIFGPLMLGFITWQIMYPIQNVRTIQKIWKGEGNINLRGEFEPKPF